MIYLFNYPTISVRIIHKNILKSKYIPSEIFSPHFDKAKGQQDSVICVGVL